MQSNQQGHTEYRLSSQLAYAVCRMYASGPLRQSVNEDEFHLVNNRGQLGGPCKVSGSRNAAEIQPSLTGPKIWGNNITQGRAEGGVPQLIDLGQHHFYPNVPAGPSR